MLPRKFVPTARLCIPGGSCHIRLCADAIGSSDNGERKSNRLGWSGTGPKQHWASKADKGSPRLAVPDCHTQRHIYPYLINQSIAVLNKESYSPFTPMQMMQSFKLPSTLSTCLGSSCKAQNVHQYSYNLHEAVCGLPQALRPGSSRKVTRAVGPAAFHPPCRQMEPTHLLSNLCVPVIILVFSFCPTVCHGSGFLRDQTTGTAQSASASARRSKVTRWSEEEVTHRPDGLSSGVDTKLRQQERRQ